jgi:hypothetical protein
MDHIAEVWNCCWFVIKIGKERFTSASRLRLVRFTRNSNSKFEQTKRK